MHMLSIVYMKGFAFDVCTSAVIGEWPLQKFVFCTSLEAPFILWELLVEFPRGVSCKSFLVFGPICNQTLDVGSDRICFVPSSLLSDIEGRMRILTTSDLDVIL